MELVTWLGIVFCISQSALFSGLNLAYFSLTRLRLEVQASTGDPMAERVLKKRRHHNYLLATILWGNVGINVLLTLLTDSIMTGVGAFVFSTVVITFFGEIIPQAYFSRHALTVGYYLAPVITVYEYLLYPVVKPVALALNWLLGEEAFHFFREPDLKEFIREHVEGSQTEIGRVEGIGALNFLTLDDLPLEDTGVPLDPGSVISVPEREGRLVLPDYELERDDPFLQEIQSSERKWIVFTDEADEPRYLLNANRFLRDVFLEKELDLRDYLHRPLVVRDPNRPLGNIMNQLIAEDHRDTALNQDVILLWSDSRRIITGSDLLRRLLQGTKLFGL